VKKERNALLAPHQRQRIAHNQLCHYSSLGRRTRLVPRDGLKVQGEQACSRDAVWLNAACLACTTAIAEALQWRPTPGSGDGPP
jgi:hypothetical protein